jgi:predicted transcriptional regulator
VSQDPKLRQDIIEQFVLEQDQPVSRDEIAFGTGYNANTISRDLRDLVSSRRIFTRLETKDERLLRFGGITRATQAGLFFHSSPVPPRTKREAVSGFVAEVNTSGTRYGSQEVDRRLAKAFVGHSPRWLFTSKSLADAADLQVGTVHTRIRTMADNGFIQRDGTRDGYSRYRVVNRNGLLNFLGVQYEITVATPAPKVETPPVPAPPKQVVGVSQIEAQVHAVLDENAKLREQVAIQRDNIRALQARVEELSKPAEPTVSADTAERLAQWRPSV